jgi:acetyltransferase-like isoleucine patch superfamily enzyme
MPRSWDRSAPPLLAIETWQRLRNRAFTLAASSSLGARGRGSVFQTPVKLAGASRIFLGENVQVGRGSWLQVLEPNGRLELRDGVRITGFLFASAAREIVIDEHALLAQNVYIADHSHARDDPAQPISMQGITDVAPVRIGAGSWLGQGVIVMPGVTIGAGAIVGSNSVVRDDVPPRSVAVGAPARVVRELD